MAMEHYIQILKKDKRLPWALMGLVSLYVLINAFYIFSAFSLGAGHPIHLSSTRTVEPIRFAKMHLFGFYLSDYDDLPETQLQLTLQGTAIAPNNASQSIAIIGTPNQEARVYHVGAAIPDGASIHAIEENRVIIDDNGALERLSMPIPQLKRVPVIPGLPINSGLSPQ